MKFINELKLEKKKLLFNLNKLNLQIKELEHYKNQKSTNKKEPPIE